MFILVFSIFTLFVFLNLALTIFLLPHMLEKFLGIETMFTMSGVRALNTTFLATAVGLTYVCTDPLIKAVYALRCFYGSSLRSGEDIKTELRNFVVPWKASAAILIFFLGSTPFCPPLAAEPADTSGSEYRFQNQVITPTLTLPRQGGGDLKEHYYSTLPGDLQLHFQPAGPAGRRVEPAPRPLVHRGLHHNQTISPEQLDRSIEEVMNRPEFSWRMPREKLREEDDHQSGPIAQIVEWIAEKLEKMGKTISRWMDKFGDWLRKFFPKPDQGEDTSVKDWIGSVRGLLFVLLAVGICLLAIAFWRTWQRRRERQIPGDMKPIHSTPDLTDDLINADDLPAKRWLILASELMEKGSLRLALRAFFLATLAHLAKNKMITIAKYKSNRDYERELRRLAHHRQSIISLFSSNVTVFDKSWYGKHEVTLEDLKLFMANQERIMGFVEE
jgi:hypothetical protein